VPPALIAQAASLGLPVYEGYGLSECGSVVCLNTPEACRPGSVGRPLPHVRVRVDENGEIHVAGAVMKGYLGEAQADRQEIATGDLGHIDADGFVYVKGRRRNLFITSLGRNVSPEWVESELLLEAPLARALVVGEARPFAAALLWASPGMADERAVAEAVRRANERLPDYAQVRRWALVPDSAEELATLLTANGRLRREAASARHHHRLEELYR
jgi:long-subunit acyl-CoA synthetase (AMP-forming)